MNSFEKPAAVQPTEDEGAAMQAAWKEVEATEASAALREQIMAADTFTDLKNLIEVVGVIHGSHATYEADQVIEQLDLVQAGETSAITLTREYGLRERALELYTKQRFAEVTKDAETITAALRDIYKVAGGAIKHIEDGDPIPFPALLGGFRAVVNGQQHPESLTDRYGLRAEAERLRAEP